MTPRLAAGYAGIEDGDLVLWRLCAQLAHRRRPASGQGSNLRQPRAVHGEHRVHRTAQYHSCVNLIEHFEGETTVLT